MSRYFTRLAARTGVPGYGSDANAPSVRVADIAESRVPGDEASDSESRGTGAEFAPFFSPAIESGNPRVAIDGESEASVISAPRAIASSFARSPDVAHVSRNVAPAPEPMVRIETGAPSHRDVSDGSAMQGTHTVSTENGRPKQAPLVTSSVHVPEQGLFESPLRADERSSPVSEVIRARESHLRNGTALEARRAESLGPRSAKGTRKMSVATGPDVSRADPITDLPSQVASPVFTPNPADEQISVRIGAIQLEVFAAPNVAAVPAATPAPAPRSFSPRRYYLRG